MLSPVIHGVRPSPNANLKKHCFDHLYALTFNRYCGSLFVISPDEISLIDSYYALPNEHPGAYIQSMENKVFGTLSNIEPVLCLAAKQRMRQRFESVSRLPVSKSLYIDRYFSPGEKALLHRWTLGMIDQVPFAVSRKSLRLNN